MNETKHKTALKATGLTVNYGNVSVLWDISCEVPTGALIGIIGPNGAGKSTFFKAALGLVKPLSGSIEFFDSPIHKIRKQIAYVPQRESVDWDFPISVYEVVLMGRYGHLGLFKGIRKADKEAADIALEHVGLSSLGNRQIGELSGGQKQRLFIARALIQDADIYLMDEPFAGVDVSSEKVIVDVMHQLKAKGKTIFVIHHDLSSVESYFDHLILLRTRLVACGPTQEVFTKENLSRTYGKNHTLFDELTKLSLGKGR